jgi:hypothetical protein
MATHLDPTISPQLVEYFSQYQVLYCHPCKSVYSLRQIDRHLAQTYSIPIKRRQPIIDYCHTLPVAVVLDGVALCPDDSPPVPFLPLLRGFTCCLCPFHTTSWCILRRHLNRAHQLFHPNCHGNFALAQLQSWYTEKRAKYWRIQTATATATAGAAPPIVYATAAEILERLEEEECSRLEQLAEDHLTADAEVEIEEISPWLNVTEWPKQFADRPVDLIRRCAQLEPLGVVAVAVAQGETYLGSFYGTDVVSSADDEARIRQIIYLFHLVFERCLATLAVAPYNIRCWLKSYNPNEFFSRPFSLTQKPATRKRYQRQWQWFLCFLFRAWRLPVTTRGLIFGPAFDLAPFEELMGQIWDLLDQAEQEPLPEPQPRLDDLVRIDIDIHGDDVYSKQD